MSLITCSTRIIFISSVFSINVMYAFPSFPTHTFYRKPFGFLNDQKEDNPGLMSVTFFFIQRLLGKFGFLPVTSKVPVLMLMYFSWCMDQKANQMTSNWKTKGIHLNKAKWILLIWISLRLAFHTKSGSGMTMLGVSLGGIQTG